MQAKAFSILFLVLFAGSAHAGSDVVGCYQWLPNVTDVIAPNPFLRLIELTPKSATEQPWYPSDGLIWLTHKYDGTSYRSLGYWTKRGDDILIVSSGNGSDGERIELKEEVRGLLSGQDKTIDRTNGKVDSRYVMLKREACPAPVDGHLLLDWTHSKERVEFAKDETSWQFAEDSATAIRFFGYVKHIVDTENQHSFCVPKDVETSRLIDLVKTWVDSHSSAQLNQRGDVIVGLALRGQYPCRR